MYMMFEQSYMFHAMRDAYACCICILDQYRYEYGTRLLHTHAASGRALPVAIALAL